MAFIPTTLRDLFWRDPFFEEAWGATDLDRMRRHMMSRQQNLFRQLQHDMDQATACCRCHAGSLTQEQSETKETDDSHKSKTTCQKQTHHQEVVRAPDAQQDPDDGNWLLTPRMWLLQDGDVKRDLEIRVTDDEQQFQVSLDTHDFRPDELSVNVKDEELVVEGKHENRSSDGKSFTSRHFVRLYRLPKECQVKDVKSNVSKDGVLIITAPKVRPNEQPKLQNIPIQMSNQ